MQLLDLINEFVLKNKGIRGTTDPIIQQFVEEFTAENAGRLMAMTKGCTVKDLQDLMYASCMSGYFTAKIVEHVEL